MALSIRGDTPPEVALSRSDDATLRAVLGVLHRLPEGTVVQLAQRVTPFPTVRLRVGDPVDVVPRDESAEDYAKHVEKAWTATG